MRKKIFKKESSISNINLYWKLAVSLMFVIFLLSFFFGYYLFAKTNKETVLEQDNTSRRAETVRKERIDKVLEYFSAREKKSNEIINSPAPVVDPSL